MQKTSLSQKHKGDAKGGRRIKVNKDQLNNHQENITGTEMCTGYAVAVVTNLTTTVDRSAK